MKFLVFLTTGSLLFAAACGGSGSGPGDAVLEMFAALQAGDGDLAVSFMSTSALEEMDSQLEMLKMDPEGSAAQLAMMGIQLDAADIPNMTAADFASTMVSAPMIHSIMETAEVSVANEVIDGDVATVDVTVSVMGETETNTIEVVKEDGAWKVTEFGMTM